MKNLQYYKRILAGVACATVLMSNLGGNSQVVFAAENSEEVVSEEPAVENTAPEPEQTPEPTYEEPEEEPVTESLEEETTETEVPDETPAEEVPEAQPEEPEETIEIIESGSAGGEEPGEETGTSEESGESGSTGSEEPTEGSETPEGTNEDGSTDSGSTEEGDEAGKAEETETVDESKELICTEDHEHTDACYKDKASEEETEETEEPEETEEVTEEDEETEDTHDELWYYIHELDCQQDHEHTDDCYKIVRELQCDKDHEHTKDCYQEIEEVIYLEEDGDIGSVIYTATASGILVKAEAAETALPEGATLKANRIESNHELSQITEELDNSDVEYDDYLALDVYFENKDGEEIEPKGSVQVTFELEESVIPEAAITDSLSVQHFDESGHKTEVVTVADAADSTDGTIQTDSNAVKAEFEVNSFSTFTITWSKNSGKDTTEITVTCVDEEGNEIDKLPNGITGSATGFELNSTNTVKFNADNNYDVTIDGYTFVKAMIGSTEISEIQATYATKNTSIWTGWRYESIKKGTWYYTITPSSGWGYSTTTKPDITLTYKNDHPTGTTLTRFYIITDGGGSLPNKDGTRTDGKLRSDGKNQYWYTSKIEFEKAIINKTEIYDTGSAEIKTENGSTYADNSVVANLAQMPTNQQIVDKINATSSLNYDVKLNEDGMIEVTTVTREGGQYGITDLRVGDILYVNWYIIKDTGDADNANGEGGWHVDGELLIKSHRAIVDTAADTNSLPYVATTVAIMVGAMFMLINYKSRRMSR